MFEFTTKTGKRLLIRRARLGDVKGMGKIAAQAYRDDALTQFLSPRRYEFWDAHEREYFDRILLRMLDSRNVSFVVEDPENQSGKPVAYLQCQRHGDDHYARSMDSEPQKTLLVVLHFLMSWFLWASAFFRPRVADPVAVAEFRKSIAEDAKKNWSGDTYKNRWYAQSVVVNDDYQGMGIGKVMIGELIKLAKEQHVPATLEASKRGRYLYSAMGFKVIAEFSLVLLGNDGGGVMMWTPDDKCAEL